MLEDRNFKQMKSMVFILAFFLVITNGYSQVHDTMHIYFELDKTQLDDRGTHMIDSIVKDNRLMHQTKITVMGYADYLGTDDYDKVISESRAKNVEDYLVIAGYSKSDITRCTGKGKINRAGTNGKKGFSEDRKVDIIFDARKDTSDNQRFQYDLEKMEPNDVLAIRVVDFYQGSLQMTPESIPVLDILLHFLQKNNTIIFQLEGHVCCLGPVNDGRDEPYDEGTLSQKRAQEVANYLIEHGIAKERLKAAIGLGNINPIREEESGLEDQRLSRRVELKIISK
jgi:outer membrane protein OmpA-like peptidoglycan-associated protein